jgi:hypothetical protein
VVQCDSEEEAKEAILYLYEHDWKWGISHEHAGITHWAADKTHIWYHLRLGSINNKIILYSVNEPYSTYKLIRYSDIKLHSKIKTFLEDE